MNSWRAAGASAQGAAHLAGGWPNQDAFAILGSDTAKRLVLVASDGAGTASHAHLGSRTACGAFLRLARDVPADVLPGDEDVRALVSEIRDALCAEADEHGLAPRDLACTLLGAVITPKWTLFVQVGDGAVVADWPRGGDAPGGLAPVFWPRGGEYANETDFLTDVSLDKLRDRVQTLVTSALPSRVALLTDGLQGIALRLKERAAHGPFFEPLFETLLRGAPGDEAAFSEALEAFLASDLVRVRTDDDLTLVLAAHAPE